MVCTARSSVESGNQGDLPLNCLIQYY